ncbi:hypothetical protein [Streptomyces sp. TR06-5]|uniref:hypothetical protein n=1 Tax=Streptomyces sp. TR06-5 TaxID=3385976 RepID=UPI0039A0D26B
MNLAFLEPLYDRPGPWASVYVAGRAAPEDATARQRTGARALSDRLHGQGADAATCRAVYGALDALPRASGPAGYAVFAADGEVVLRTPLASAPSGEPGVSWGALPRVAPLPRLTAGPPSALRRAAEAMEHFLAARVPDDEGRTNATEGVPTLVEAAREHRIDALLVRPDGPDLHREVWVGDDPDQLAVRHSEHRYLGAPEPAASRADDALLRSAATTGADVVYVQAEHLAPGTPRGLPAGGLGALLRWPYGGAKEEPGEAGEEGAFR